MAHSHWEEKWGWGEPDCTEIDEHVCLRRTVHGGNPDITDSATGEMAGGPDEHLAGYIMGHDRDGEEYRCDGGISIDEHLPKRHRWQQTGSLEGGDLTLTPSVLCACGFHGFITNGKWVSA